MPAGSQPIFPTTDSEGTGSLAPKAEVTVEVVFDPVDNGEIDEELVILNNLGDGSYRIHVTGTAQGSAVVNVLGTEDSVILSGSSATAAANGTDF